MRVLEVGTLRLQECAEPASREDSEYAILSHTWSTDEVLPEDLEARNLEATTHKAGYAKIYHASEQAALSGCKYLWADTCCIDKKSSAELQEIINSMYRYYALARVCYVHLDDVTAGPGWEGQVRRSRWFTRAWTLQELVAPVDVQFFDRSWTLLGHLQDLLGLVASITTIPVSLLKHKRIPTTYSIAQRMSWAAGRQASRVEDIAYSLLGIFDVNLTMLYGEGNKAFTRLQEEIMRISTDHSIFTWWRDDDDGNAGPRGVLASSPAAFSGCGTIGRLSGLLPGAFQLTNRGLEIPLPVAEDPEYGPEAQRTLALLDCYRSGTCEKPYFALELCALPKLLNPKHARIDPTLFTGHVTDAYLVSGLRLLSTAEFQTCSAGHAAQKISLFSGREIRTMDLFAPGQPWMAPAARYTRG
ncbi:hypothetical protein LTR53_005704 [Teratosphaeriaceae sp. CCFEE 6253]|nr:hypothetical protein LTR53_005704 [Teratosphaeriaceae sp. CCFEE 6253]